MPTTPLYTLISCMGQRVVKGGNIDQGIYMRDVLLPPYIYIETLYVINTALIPNKLYLIVYVSCQDHKCRKNAMYPIDKHPLTAIQPYTVQ